MSHNLSLPDPDARGPKNNGQEQDTSDLSLTSVEFFEKNLSKLTRFCHQRWNGNGADVLQEAAKQGLKYDYMTFSLFTRLALDAARDLKISRWQHTEEGAIILPPTRHQKMKCEKCGCDKFTDTLSWQKMCIACGEKVDPPAPVFDPGEDDENTIDDEKITEIETNTLHAEVQAVLAMVMAGENLIEAVKKAGISYSTFRKKAREAYLQPSLFPMAGGAR